MKNLIFLFSFLVFAMSLNAQNATQTRQRTDTSAASTTTYVYFPASGSFSSPFDYEFAASSTQISGNSNAKVWLEAQPYGSAIWIPRAATDTLRLLGDGATGFLSGSTLGGRLRAKIVTTAATQSTQFKTAWVKQISR